MEQTPNSTFAHRVIEIMRRYCNVHYGGNARAFSSYIGIDPETGMVSRWLRGGGAGPTLQKIGPVMDKLGVVLIDPDNPMDNCTANRMGHDEAVKALQAVEKELEQAKLMISQLTGERNAFRDMVLTLTQQAAGGQGNVTNSNIKNF